jgi:hypothetical protein
MEITQNINIEITPEMFIKAFLEEFTPEQQQQVFTDAICADMTGVRTGLANAKEFCDCLLPRQKKELIDYLKY